MDIGQCVLVSTYHHTYAHNAKLSDDTCMYQTMVIVDSEENKQTIFKNKKIKLMNICLMYI